MKCLHFGLAALLLSAVAIQGSQWYVSPAASSSGNGTLTSPWQLQVALKQPTSVKPGDTIWLRGGTYVGAFTSELTGTTSAPIVVRQYPGERAIIDGKVGNNDALALTVNGSDTWYWGFEITGTAAATPDLRDGGGLNIFAPRSKFINLVVHDTASVGVRMWMEAPESELYGSVIYYNGRNQGGYALYAQNDTGVKSISDNIMFYQWGNYGFHLYTENARVNNFNLEGNIHFQNAIGIGGPSAAATNITLTSNYIYADENRVSGMVTANFGFIGWGAGTQNLKLDSNYIVAGPNGSIEFQSPFAGLILQNNTFNGMYYLDQSIYLNNSYYVSPGHTPPRPSGQKVFIRPNRYEPGRANIAVFNWDKQGSVGVDVSKVDRFNLGTKTGTGPLLNVGDSYEIRDAQNFLGAPIQSGTYNGSPLDIPMNSTTMPTPIGMPTPKHTGTEFGAFVILKTAAISPPPSNGAPTISSIPNVAVDPNTSTSPLEFSVADQETPASQLIVSGTSANTTLIPVSNITFGGSGSARTLTVTPAANQFGSVTITVRVSDGLLSADSSFTLTVRQPRNTAPTISTIPNVTIQANASTAALAFTVADNESAASSLTVSSQSSNPTLVPVTNIALTGSGSNRGVTIIPAANQSGSSTITVSVSDGSLTASTSFALSVQSVNVPLFYLTVEAESAALTVPFQAALDSLASGGAYAMSALANNGTSTLTVSVPTAAECVIWGRVKSADADSDSFFVSVDGGTEDVYDTAENSWSTSWQWSLVNGRNGGNPRTLNPRLFSLSPGNHRIGFRSRDPNTALDEIIVTNDRNYVPTGRSNKTSPPNSAPLLATVPNLTATVDSALTWQLNGTDGDVPAQTLSYRLVAGPTGATVNATSGLFSWTPSASQASSSSALTVQVSDSGSPALSASRTFTVIVLPLNTAPVLDPVPNLTVVAGKSLTWQLTAADRDLPGQKLLYSLIAGPPGATVNSATGLFTCPATAVSSAFPSKVTVGVMDNGAPPLSATQSFTVALSASSNTAPILATVRDYTAVPGKVVMLALSGTDQDIPAQKLTYSLISGPSGAFVDAKTGLFIWRLTKSAAAATYKVTVAVKDNGTPSLSAMQSFNIVVTAKLSSSFRSASASLTGVETVSWVAELNPERSIRFTCPIQAASQSVSPSFYLETSEDLVDWTALGLVSDRSELTDTAATSASRRFYRIRAGQDAKSEQASPQDGNAAPE